MSKRMKLPGKAMKLRMNISEEKKKCSRIKKKEIRQCCIVKRTSHKYLSHLSDSIRIGSVKNTKQKYEIIKKEKKCSAICIQ